MSLPNLPIDVDDDTGVWTTDGLPMIYVPQHFFVNNHKAVEEALGIEEYRAILNKAGYKSAYFWCDQESKTHGLNGVAVFEHYLKRLSQRGWGLFSLAEISPESGTAKIHLAHSAFVQQYGKHIGRKVCYMFEGWFVGAMEWVGESMGHPIKVSCHEHSCVSETEATLEQDCCVFVVSPL